MAVSKVSYITSYYNGIARLYIMTKDGNNITTNLVSEIPTDEHNGLEVTVKNINNIMAYESAIKKLVFFPNVYIDGVYNDINTLKVKRFKHFTFTNTVIEDKILLGNVAYPLDRNYIPSELITFYNSISHSGVLINFNIGELNVTPNRESIIYNSKTAELITQRLKEAEAEICNIIKKSIPTDTKNPYEYYDLKVEKFSYDFISDTRQRAYSKSMYPVFSIQDYDIPLTFCGKTVNHNIIGRIYRSSLPNIKAIKDYDTWKKDNYTWYYSQIARNAKIPVLLLPESQKITKYIKAYLNEHYSQLVICNKNDFEPFKKMYTDSYCYNSQITDEELFILQNTWNFILTRFFTIDFDNNPDFIAFKENLKKETKENRITLNESVILTIHRDGGYRPTKYNYTNYSSAIKAIKKFKKGVLIRNLDAMGIGDVASRLGYVTIGANKKVVDLLNKEQLTCKITEDNIKNNKRLIEHNTFIKTNFYYHVSNFSRIFTKSLPQEFKDVIYKACTRRDEFAYCVTSYVKDNCPIDEDLTNLCNTIIANWKAYEEYRESLEIKDVDSEELLTYLIMKNKLYKISYDCYKKIKNNKLLKALCEK